MRNNSNLGKEVKVLAQHKHIGLSVVNRSTIVKKLRPHAKGHSYPIKRTMCHITIVLKEKSKSLLDLRFL